MQFEEAEQVAYTQVILYDPSDTELPVLQMNELDGEQFTVENILLDLGTKRAQLDLNNASNPGVILAYERRQGEVCAERPARMRTRI